VNVYRTIRRQFHYRAADKSLARPTSRCIFLWWEYFFWC